MNFSEILIKIQYFHSWKCIWKCCLKNIRHFVHASHQWVNTLRPRQNGRHFADNIFKCIFLNENVWIPIKISLKFVPQGPINNIPALVQIMAWHRPGNKPLSESMTVSLLTHICVTRPQWVKTIAATYTKFISTESKMLLWKAVNARQLRYTQRSFCVWAQPMRDGVTM